VLKALKLVISFTLKAFPVISVGSINPYLIDSIVAL
jgi:hypothetical protein